MVGNVKLSQLLVSFFGSGPALPGKQSIYGDFGRGRGWKLSFSTQARVWFAQKRGLKLSLLCWIKFCKAFHSVWRMLSFCWKSYFGHKVTTTIVILVKIGTHRLKNSHWPLLLRYFQIILITLENEGKNMYAELF